MASNEQKDQYLEAAAKVVREELEKQLERQRKIREDEEARRKGEK